MATCCVPWHKDGAFAADIFRRQVRHILKNLTRHVYVFGTAGEGHAVSDPQFDEIIRVFREETRQPGVFGMVGVISLSLPTIIERIGRARDLGFRRFQISLPSWGALSDGELARFFQETCGRFRDCQFLHYNLLRTKRLLTPDEYAGLAKQHPNLVATKNSTDSTDRILQLISRSPELQHFITEAGFPNARLVGECGFLVSIASVHFGLARKFFEAGRKRNLPLLFRLQREVRNLTHDMLALCGDGRMDSAYDKLYCKIHDPEFPLRLLPPYQGFEDALFRKFTRLIGRKYPRWSSTRP